MSQALDDKIFYCLAVLVIKSFYQISSINNTIAWNKENSHGMILVEMYDNLRYELMHMSILSKEFKILLGTILTTFTKYLISTFVYITMKIFKTIVHAYMYVIVETICKEFRGI